MLIIFYIKAISFKNLKKLIFLILSKYKKISHNSCDFMARITLKRKKDDNNIDNSGSDRFQYNPFKKKTSFEKILLLYDNFNRSYNCLNHILVVAFLAR